MVTIKLSQIYAIMNFFFLEKFDHPKLTNRPSGSLLPVPQGG
jgi:hypothetical protein